MRKSFNDELIIDLEECCGAVEAAPSYCFGALVEQSADLWGDLTRIEEKWRHGKFAVSSGEFYRALFAIAASRVAISPHSFVQGSDVVGYALAHGGASCFDAMHGFFDRRDAFVEELSFARGEPQAALAVLESGAVPEDVNRAHFLCDIESTYFLTRAAPWESMAFEYASLRFEKALCEWANKGGIDGLADVLGTLAVDAHKHPHAEAHFYNVLKGTIGMANSYFSSASLRRKAGQQLSDLFNGLPAESGLRELAFIEDAVALGITPPRVQGRGWAAPALA